MNLLRTAILVLILTSFLGITCAYYPYNTPVPDNQDLIFEVFSVAGVNCGNPPVPSTFTISEERTIVMIATYHWCDGKNPGTISLQGQDGTIYGPWQAIGRDGSGGASNRYWEVGFADGLNLPAGTYTIVDSRPGTWSWTEDVGNRGHSYLFVLNEETGGSAQPCSNYWGPIEPTGTEAAGPRQSPGKYILVYAEVPKSSDSSQSLPANWNWKNFGPIDLNGGKRYFLVFGRSSDPELFEEQNLPIEETLVTATRDTAIIWDSNKATSDVRYAYCLQPELVGPVAKSPLTNNYSGEAISERSGKTWPFKLTLIGPDMNSSISGQIEWTSLDSIHQIVGSKTTAGITFTETADIKKGGAVLNCRYYLNSEGNSFTGTWDSCDDGDYGTISMKT